VLRACVFGGRDLPARLRSHRISSSAPAWSGALLLSEVAFFALNRRGCQPRASLVSSCAGSAGTGEAPLQGHIGLLAALRPHERVLVLLQLLGGEQRVGLAKNAIEAIE
jgi:hypothetical protein